MYRGHEAQTQLLCIALYTCRTCKHVLMYCVQTHYSVITCQLVSAALLLVSFSKSQHTQVNAIIRSHYLAYRAVESGTASTALAVPLFY